MIPYFLLLVIPFLYNVCYQAIFNHGRVSLINNKNDYKSPVVTVFFVCFILILMFRGRTVGLDLPNYNYMFNKYSASSLWSLIGFEADVLYKVLNWTVSRFTKSFQWIIVVSSVLSVAPIYFLYSKDKRNGYLKVVLFINTAIFMVLFSALRQAISIGIGVLAYKYVRESKPWKFALMVLLANTFHHSAFIMILMYPIYHTRLNSRHLWMVIPVFVAFYIFKEQIFVFTTSLMTNFYDKYDSDMTSTGAMATFLLYVAFSVYSYVVPDENKMTKELIGLRNFLVVATALQSFAGLNSLAMRMNYYFIIFIPYTMCKLVEIPKREFRRVALISKCVMCAFFTWYFIDSIIKANNTNDLLGIVPYVSMWR